MEKACASATNMNMHTLAAHRRASWSPHQMRAAAQDRQKETTALWWDRKREGRRRAEPSTSTRAGAGAGAGVGTCVASREDVEEEQREVWKPSFSGTHCVDDHAKDCARDRYYQVASREYFFERYEVSRALEPFLSATPLYGPSDVFALRPNAVVSPSWRERDDETEACHPVEEVPGVPGAFVVGNVLTHSECERMLSILDDVGWEETAPEGTCVGAKLRRNSVSVIMSDSTLLDAIMYRMRDALPQRDDESGGELVGINARFRVYRYRPMTGETFKPHIDSPWPGSGIDTSTNSTGTLVYDNFGDRLSRMTLLLYLNDDYTGGETSFFPGFKTPREMLDASSSSSHAVRKIGAKVPKGAALCFWHGDHPHSPVHEGSPVLSETGEKCVIRSDVLFTVNENGCER